MNRNDAVVASGKQESAQQYLSWENLGAQPPWSAFWQSLKELAFQPADFFDKMSVSGGLHEPLSFLWIVLLLGILPTFPLTLSYFALSAPAPARVSVDVYNAHLLLPRVAGLVTILLPLVLVFCGLLAVLCGSLLHLAARLFGARGWEGSVSVWCYASSLGLTPIAVGLMAGAAVSMLCYLVTLLSPDMKVGAAAVARVALWGLLGTGALMGTVAFLMAVLTGCVRGLKLAGASGVAAGLAGLAMVGTLLMLLPLSFHVWGVRAGATVLVIFAFLVILSALVPAAARSEAQL